MTPDQRQQTVDFLRDLAAWLEDGEELEFLSRGEWGTVPTVIFDGIWDLAWRVRVKPKPLELLEGWLVILKGVSVSANVAIYCESEDAVARVVDANRDEWIRTVPIREVQ